MTTQERTSTLRLASGAVAGALAALVFAVVHQLTIVSIWDMTLVLVVSGALSGILLVWTFRRMTERPSVAGWVRYNLA